LLREIEKRDEKELVAFLDKRYDTILQYFIEKMNQKKIHYMD